ncbi:MAG: hypothetical protein M3390_12410 [Chloroflexota bacterium]|nr:hypothetical protein [Chloroflexota bacterium]
MLGGGGAGVVEDESLRYAQNDKVGLGPGRSALERARVNGVSRASTVDNSARSGAAVLPFVQVSSP